MGTKNNPGKFGSYQEAEPDEPMFVLLARDPEAPFLVRLWGDKNFKKIDKRAAAIECADAMEAWRRSNVAAPSPAQSGGREVKRSLRK